MSTLAIPELSLVCLVGVSGSGKSTFARTHFGPYEVVSSDFCRGLVADDENDQGATSAAFDVLEYIVGKRLEAGRLTVVDATSVQSDARKKLIELARAHDVLPVAIVLDVPEALCLERNAKRSDRIFGPEVVHRQRDQLRRGLRNLKREGFRRVHILGSDDEIAQANIVRERLLNDYKDLHGPFDVIGDVHGCLAELEDLLTTLGYAIESDVEGRPVKAVHPEGRTVIYLGDLVDRGPDSPGVLRLVMGMVEAGHALCVPGNHENKLVRALRGAKVQVTHGLAETLDQLSREDGSFSSAAQEFCDGLISHLVLDDGKLVVAHAGLKEAYHGRASARVRSFALYGDTTGETDEFGLPVRYPWANDYRGRAMVLYGHTPIPEVEWINNTMCLDTGCVFGGKLTALRYPEREVVSVAAHRVWYEPAKPFLTAIADSRTGDDLSLSDVLGKRVVETRLAGRVTVREENAAAALEVMSRFALEPRWLPYLPPTMAPCATSPTGEVLEHPASAFDSYRETGIAEVLCEEKHMGSRAVVYVLRDQGGAVYTRTGRSFFDPPTTETLVGSIRQAVADAGLWEELGTTSLLLDCELLPWSAKAEDLLRHQYAAVGAAARAATPAAEAVLQQAFARGVDVAELLTRARGRSVNALAFTDSYRRYVWPTSGLDGVQLAPFQVLATDGSTYFDRDHLWHLELADRLVTAAPTLFRTTRRLQVDTTGGVSVADGIDWWMQLTDSGGEGMVVKPLANLVRGGKGWAQPGIKVRGREYLRIIYGPDYTEPVHLERLRQRGLGHKRSLAMREYALGVESLERFARGEPLWRVHEPVFAVLALESEPVDPRL